MTPPLDDVQSLPSSKGKDLGLVDCRLQCDSEASTGVSESSSNIGVLFFRMPWYTSSPSSRKCSEADCAPASTHAGIWSRQTTAADSDLQSPLSTAQPSPSFGGNATQCIGWPELPTSSTVPGTSSARSGMDKVEQTLKRYHPIVPSQQQRQCAQTWWWTDKKRTCAARRVVPPSDLLLRRRRTKMAHRKVPDLTIDLTQLPPPRTGGASFPTQAVLVAVSGKAVQMPKRSLMAFCSDAFWALVRVCDGD